MTREETEKIIKTQLSYEMNCSPEDFSKDENIITSAVFHEKRRRFSCDKLFLQMMTFGRNAVISADETIHPWLTEWVKGKKGFWLFEQHNFYELECELRKHGYKMAPTHHMFSPRTRGGDITPDFPVKWLEQADITPFYGREEFPNAICDHFIPDRPDVLAIIALDGDNIMGMAGVSADSPEMWQIGIDVLPQYRGKGIAKTLVSLIRNETMKRGALPYYGTSLSNIASWRTAVACGFEPMWIEVEARKIKDNEFAK